MGSEYVQDPFWGNWATGLAKSISAAPGVALNNAQTVEQIWALREKRARDTETWDAAKRTADAYGNAIPEASVPPIIIPQEGPVQPGEDPLPSSSVIDPRALAAAQADRQLAITGGRASILADPKQWAPQRAYGQIATAGVPLDPRERAKWQFMTTGRFPTSDETKLQGATNFTIYDANGPTGRTYSTRNGVTTLEGVPISSLYDPRKGETALESGAAKIERSNPIENTQIAQNNFNQLAEQLQQKIAANQPLSDRELNAARMMRDTGWSKKVKVVTDPATGRRMPESAYDIEPPTAGAAGWLFDLLDDIDGTRRPQAAPPASPFPPPPAPGTAQAPLPTMTEQPPITPPAPAAPAPTAPAASGRPLVTAGPAYGTGDPQPVVTSYRQQPVIVAIENAKSGYSSLLGNIANNDKSADLAIIVGAAKVLDPPSVVREGEVENVRKTGGIMDQFIGMIQGAKGESGLSLQVRAQLWQMVNDKLKLDADNARAVREQHAVQLRQRNVDPETYLPPLPEIVPVDPKRISTQRIDTTGARRTVAPGAPAPGTKPPIVQRGDAVFGD